MEYLATKINKVPIHATTLMNLENTLSEISHRRPHIP